MLKMRSGGLVVLGLSDMNLVKLQEGKPIAFDGSTLGLAGVEKVVIFNAATEAEMERMLREDFGFKIPG